MRRYKIGRSETNEIVVADASVSRQHAELVELGEGRFSLTDLGSTYGTHVLQGQNWVAAAETEIHPDTVIRFGEFQTTLMDALSDAQREALGLLPQKASAPPPPKSQSSAAAAPAAKSEPVSRTTPATPASAPPPTPVAAPPAAPRSEERRLPRAEIPPPPRVAARPRAAPGASRQRSLMMGLLGLGTFVGLAAAAIAVIVVFGDANPAPRPDTSGPAGAAEAQARFLESCTKQWEVEERRCRCFLAAAGPHLQGDDYDDLAEMVEAYVSGDTDRQESALQRATEKRGVPANSRLTAAFKGVVRDCQQ